MKRVFSLLVAMIFFCFPVMSVRLLLKRAYRSVLPHRGIHVRVCVQSVASAEHRCAIYAR